MKFIRSTYPDMIFQLKGYSLIESAIVLAIIALVLGSTWVASGKVIENKKIEDTLSGLFFSIHRLQDRYAIDDALSVANGTAVTSTLIALKVYPENWITSSTKGYNPFGGSLWATVAYNATGSPNARVNFAINGVPASACVQLLIRTTSNIEKSSSTSLVGLGLQTVAVNGYSTWHANTFPIDLNSALSACTLNINNLSFVTTLVH